VEFVQPVVCGVRGAHSEHALPCVLRTSTWYQGPTSISIKSLILSRLEDT